MTGNRMAEVAALFGKNLEEAFKIRRIVTGKRIKICQGKFTNKGLFICCWTDEFFQSDSVMRQLLTGRAEIVEDKDDG